jgi:DnaJ-class molecular chaperone
MLNPRFAHFTRANSGHNQYDFFPSSREKFQEISHAYSVLSDPEKRKRYDQYGDAEDDEDMDINDFMQVL